jgi:hypothetical protein
MVLSEIKVVLLTFNKRIFAFYSERMEVLENKMTRECDAKLKIVMEEQYDNKVTIKVLEETIVKQNNYIVKLQNMEETLNLQREEITALNEIVDVEYFSKVVSGLWEDCLCFTAEVLLS